MVVICGIAGFSLSPASTIDVKQLSHYLLQLAEERGIVASGWAYQEGTELKYWKNARPGGRLPVKGIPATARTVILHTRNATMGDPKFNRNNHPVISQSGNIALVHNGIVKNHQGFRKEWPTLAEVDSAVLPELVERHGVAGLSEITGWAAVAWLSRDTPEVLHLARQGDAPLVLVTLKDGSTLFASTFGIVLVSLRRMGLENQISWGYDVPDHQAIELTDGTISHLDTVPAFVYANSIYKASTASTTSYQTQAEKEEEKRLRAITMGEKYTPPKTTTSPYVQKGTTPPKMGSVGPVGTPYTSPYTSHTPSPPTPRMPVAPKKVSFTGVGPVNNREMEERLAAFDKQSKSAPPSTYRAPVTHIGTGVTVGSQFHRGDEDLGPSGWPYMWGGDQDEDLPDEFWPSGRVLYDESYRPRKGEIEPGELPVEIEQCMIYWVDFKDGTTETNFRDYTEFVCSHRIAFDEDVLRDWGFCDPFNIDKKWSLKKMRSQKEEIETIIFNINKMNAAHAKLVQQNREARTTPASRTARGKKGVK